jgi:hypothetical protein
MQKSTKNVGRAVTVRTISGHAVNIGRDYSSGAVALDPSTSTGRRLASGQPNTDRRRYLVSNAGRK